MHLCSLDPADSEFPVLDGGCCPLSCLLLLEVLQRAREAERGAVEQPSPELEWEEELAVECEWPDPCRQVVPADRQDVLQ